MLKGLAGVSAVGLGGLAYAGLYEMNAFRLRRFDVPVLPAGAAPIRVLHISDLHMTPQATARQRWVAGLAGLEPDLVVNTGDNISHLEAGRVRSPQSRPTARRPGSLRLGLERLLRADAQESDPLSDRARTDGAARQAQAAVARSGPGVHRRRVGGTDQHGRPAGDPAASGSVCAEPTTPT